MHKQCPCTAEIQLMSVRFSPCLCSCPGWQTLLLMLMYLHGLCAMTKYEISGVLLTQICTMIKHLPSMTKFGYLLFKVLDTPTVTSLRKYHSRGLLTLSKLQEVHSTVFCLKVNPKKNIIGLHIYNNITNAWWVFIPSLLLSSVYTELIATISSPTVFWQKSIV